MFIKTLNLERFRNYTGEEVVFNKSKTVLLDENAQGKTNIIEAIIFLSTLDSNRIQANSDLIQFGEEYTIIKGHLNTKMTDYDLEIAIHKDGRKVCKMNGVKKNKAEEFLGKLATVSFSIQDMQLLRGDPSDRRRWLDSAISQLYPAYHAKLLKYTKIKNQRNSFLKSTKGMLDHHQRELLAVWDEQLIISGSNVLNLRQKYLKEIAERAAGIHQRMSFGKEELCMMYNSTVIPTQENSEYLYTGEEIVEFFRHKLEEIKNKEILRGQTMIGPHRDDIDFFIYGKDAKFFGSQGQQRTIVIALKLSEIDFMTSIIQDTPVLIMDDVMAELDMERQKWLIDSINEEVQVIMTTTHLSNFNPQWLDSTQVLTISGGKLLGETIEV